MSQALVDLREKLKSELTGLRNTVPAPSGRTISTKGKVFTFPDSKTSQGPIEAIILDHRNFNKYYAAAYNPNQPTSPKCFAISKEIAGLAPHADAVDKQSDACEPCTWNQWGSAPTGKGKACRNTVRLAIAPPDATEESEPYIISVAPTGIKSWSGLVNALGTRDLLPMQVVTAISFDANQAYPVLLFKPLRPVEDDKLALMWALRQKAQLLLDTPPGAQG